MTMNPNAVIDAVERDPVMPAGPGDVFSGWGVIGLPFRSGHVLALRRYFLSSLGPAYTSIWHRDPAGRWTFYSTVAPDCSCARYFGAEIFRNVVTPIDLEWTTPSTLQARVGVELTWQITLHASPLTRLLSTLTRLIPERAARLPAVLGSIALSADAAFGTGRMNLTGQTPNGHRFVMTPRQFWLIDATTARVSGHDLGPPGPQSTQPALGDMRLPQRGVFAVASVRLARPVRGEAPARHGAPCTAKLIT